MESLAAKTLSVNSHSMHCLSLPVVDRRTGRMEAHTMNTSTNDCLVDYLLSDQRGFQCPAEFSQSQLSPITTAAESVRAAFYIVARSEPHAGTHNAAT